MKTLFLMLVTCLTVTTSTLQKSVPVVFYGYDGEYNFTVIADDGEETSETITFAEIDQAFVDKFNLQSENTEGQEFIIIYTTENSSNTSGEDEEEEESEDEESEDEIINTLIAIEKR